MESLEARMLLTTGPLITEFLAVNDSTLADGDGRFSDWIEIHNPTSSPASLDGWHLTDDRNDLAQWPLPNIDLEAGEHLVVFASGQDVDNYVDPQGYYHTNFRLAGAGGDLLLVEPDGVTYDSTFLDYPEQSTDISFGISIDGVTETLLESTAPLSYRVPTSDDHPTSWTAVDFDDRQFTREQTVAGAGLLITEVSTGDDLKSVEIQNVSADDNRHRRLVGGDQRSSRGPKWRGEYGLESAAIRGTGRNSLPDGPGRRPVLGRSHPLATRRARLGHDHERFRGRAGHCHLGIYGRPDCHNPCRRRIAPRPRRSHLTGRVTGHRSERPVAS